MNMHVHAPMKIRVTAIKIIVRFIKIIVHLSGHTNARVVLFVIVGCTFGTKRQLRAPATIFHDN